MDDFVFSSPNYTQTNHSKKPNKKKNFLVAFMVFILICLAIYAAYFFGKNSNNDSSIPGIQIQDANEILQSPKPTQKPQDSASISATIIPTKKPSSTPTISPTLTPTPTPTIKSKILSASSELDGFRSSNNGGNSGVDIRAGRNIYLVTRGFVSFDISDIPSFSTITEAKLRIYQAKIEGNPYSVGGSLKLDHLTYGDSLDSSDYGVAALSSGFATLTSNQTIEWKDADVTEKLKDDIANARSNTQYRIHFSTEVTGGDLTGDFAYFESEENYLGTGNTPQLIIKYY